jgi:hypothetical protein
MGRIKTKNANTASDDIEMPPCNPWSSPSKRASFHDAT